VWCRWSYRYCSPHECSNLFRVRRRSKGKNCNRASGACRDLLSRDTKIGSPGRPIAACERLARSSRAIADLGHWSVLCVEQRRATRWGWDAERLLREESREHEFKAIQLVLIKHEATQFTHVPHMARLTSTLSSMGDDFKHEHTHDGPSAIRAAEVASRILIALREPAPSDAAPVSPDQLRDRGDQAAHEAITSALREVHLHDAILSEEAADDPRRLGADRVWIIDPLDGTREYGEQDAAGVWRDDFAVHVALWERGRGLVVGVVGLPARGEMYSSENPPEVPPSPEGALRIAVSRTRPPAFIAAFEAAGRATLVPMGSAGVKVMAVVRGDVDVYIHAGGQYQWDSAAPVAVAIASGLVATRLDGSPLKYNVPELLLPDLVVCHPDRADEVRALLDAAGFGPDGANGAGATRASAAESAG